MHTGRPDIVLRVNAAVYGLIGVFLLLAPRHSLYDVLDLPTPDPELFTQLAGALFVAFAVLLWEAPSHPVLQRAVGRAAALANALGAMLTALWLISGELDLSGLGNTTLWVLTVVLAALAALEARFLRADA
jgi:hypothetical protein